MTPSTDRFPTLKLPLVWTEGSKCWVRNQRGRIRMIHEGHALVRLASGVLDEFRLDELELVPLLLPDVPRIGGLV